MKNIPPYLFPTFYARVTKDPDTFLFEFDILCHNYAYNTNAKKICLFPTTFKGATLRWLMGLCEGTIAYWDDMKIYFLNKYQPCCRPRYSQEDIFQMIKKEDESLRDYLETFLYNLQKSKQHNLSPAIIHTIFLKGICDEFIYILNLMGVGDISHLTFDMICDLWWKFSMTKAKTGAGIRNCLSKVTKLATGGVSREKLRNWLEGFKTDLLNTLTSQIDDLKISKNKEEKELVLSIFSLNVKRNIH